MGNVKKIVGEAALGAAALAGFAGGLGQVPRSTTDQLSDAHDSQVRQRETSIGEYRGMNQPKPGQSK